MTKGELLEAVAKEAGISKVSAEKAFNAFTSSVTNLLKAATSLVLQGLGYSALRGLQTLRWGNGLRAAVR